MSLSLFPYIWRHTKWEQLWLLLVILLSMPFYFLSLDLPKTIVNGPIQGKSFPDPSSTQPFLRLDVDIPGFADPVLLFPGISMERLPYLVALSLLFLALVCVNGAFKYYLNIYKGRLGERMLRRLRYDLVDRVLRFPPSQFKRMKAPEVATMVKDEVEPLGGFIGDAFTQPLFLGGQALTAMVFILVQSLWLGIIAAGIVAVQAFIIPRLRSRLLVLGKERQLTARDLAGRVGEIVDGITEIRVNDATNWERADFAKRLGRIFWIRYELYNRKFFVKFLNNFLSQVTPFLFYLIGGYYAIKGELDIGQLVAVIAAYKDLPSPIKELIDWDQQRQDVEIKFTQVMEQFEPEGMIAPKLQAPSPTPAPALAGRIDITRLAISDDTGARLVENVSASFGLDERIAVVGQVNAGGETVSDALARLVWPTTGAIRIGGADIAGIPESTLGRRIGYAGPVPYFPNLSIRDCMLQGLRHAPLRPAAKEARPEDVMEAVAAGNTTLDIDADWIDREAAGIDGGEALDKRLIAMLKLVEMDEEVYQQGLRSRVDPNEHRDLAKHVLWARKELKQRLADPALAKLVEQFDPERYNKLATIAANLLFGAPVDSAFESDNLPTNAYVLRVLKETGLDETLYEMGRRIASTVVELFGDLPPNHPFFEQLSFMTADDLPGFRAALARTTGQKLVTVSRDDRALLLRLPFRYIETRHRLGLLDEAFEVRIVEARKRLRASLPANLAAAVAFYDPDAYNTAASLQENILFGRIAFGIADGPERVRKLVQELLEQLGLQEIVYTAGLSFMVGSGGKRLTQPQRQKVALARAVLKRPDLLILNRSLNALDVKAQHAIVERLMALSRDEADGRRMGLFVVLTTPALAEIFDRVLCFEDGTIAEDGTPQALKAKNGVYAQLAA